jgi:parallel beta-helix repeat protein
MFRQRYTNRHVALAFALMVATLLSVQLRTTVSATPSQIVVTTSIQDAVDAASPGDVIRVPPGTYHENVEVTESDITIIGSPAAILDGEFVGSDGMGLCVMSTTGFRLTGLTVRNFEYGVFLQDVDGFEVSHGVFRDNEEYGVFPVLSSNGVIDFNDVSGSNDAGIYVGLSSDIVVKHNHVTDSTTGIEIENSARIEADHNLATDNTIGVLVVLLPGLPVKTLSDVVVTSNVLNGNNRPNPYGEPDPEEIVSLLPSGIGLLVVAGDGGVLQHNVAKHNNSAGIAVVSLSPDLAELDDQIDPEPDGYQIVDNVALQNGTEPDPNLGLPQGADLFWDGTGSDNCWASNVFMTSIPDSEFLPACS